jgi:hypothetical protein
LSNQWLYHFDSISPGVYFPISRIANLGLKRKNTFSQ